MMGKGIMYYLKFTSIEKIYFFIWTFYAVIRILFDGSMLSQYSFVENLYMEFNASVVIMLVLLFILVRRYSRQRFIFSILCVISIIFVIPGFYLQVGLLFALIAPCINIEKLIRYDMKLKFVLLTIVVLLCEFGFIENKTGYVKGVYKQSLGFVNQNTLTWIVVHILLEWIFLSYGQIKVRQYIIIFAAMVAVSAASKGRTSLYTFGVVLVLFTLANWRPKIFYGRLSRILFAVITPGMAALCFLLSYLYKCGNTIAIKINNMTTNRVRYAADALSVYDLKLFAGIINRRGHRMQIDMSYIDIAVRSGMLFLILICLVCSVQFLKCLKQKRIDIALFILYFVISGFGENYMVHVAYNASILYLLCPKEALTNEAGEKKYG